MLTDEFSLADLPSAGGPTVILREIFFTPSSEFLSEAELAAIRDSYLGQQLDFRDISSLVREVNSLYEQRVLSPQPRFWSRRTSRAARCV